MSDRPKKLKRISRACDFCRRRSTRCTGIIDSLDRCQNCSDFNVPCTFNHPAKRRGAKPKAGRNAGRPATSPTLAAEFDPGNIASSSQHSQQDSSSRSGDPWSSLGAVWSGASGNDDFALGNSWKAFAIASGRTIRNLVEVYFEIVYPIFPLFHRPLLLEKLNNHQYLKDPGTFTSVMAVCSLASARVRDGALYSNHWSSSELAEPPSEAFYAAARECIPSDLSAAKGTDYMRACAIMAIASIQNGQTKAMQQYAGIYHTLSAMDGLHDEKLWPKDLSPIDIEERRRLFWSMYTLDIYSSIVWGGVIRYREAHSMVRYPSEVDDEFITHIGYGAPPIRPDPATASNDRIAIVSRQPVNWLRGWNFTTDLYRILEYAVDCHRRRSTQSNGTRRVWSFFGPAAMSEASVMEQVLAMYSALPSQFRETLPVTGDPGKNLFGFQSANIQATLQLLRMVLFSAEDSGVEKKCDVAGELLSVFSRVPVGYLKAISSPLLHHLGGIGHLLGSVMEGSLSETYYQRVRTLLLELADLLQRLESGLHRAAGASQRLRSQVDRIDEYMRTQRSKTLAPLQPQNNAGLDASLIDQPVTAVAAPDGVADPSLHQQDAAAIDTDAMGYADPLSQFQLPQELLEDWPWPFDLAQSEGLLPLGFEHWR